MFEEVDDGLVIGIRVVADSSLGPAPKTVIAAAGVEVESKSQVVR